MEHTTLSKANMIWDFTRALDSLSIVDPRKWAPVDLPLPERLREGG
jgi:hypothetical protein